MEGARPASGSVEADRVFRLVFWRTMPLLIACYILAFVDRSNVGFAKLQFSGDLGFSEAVYGLGGGIFYLGYSLFEVPSNLILARIGARLTLLRIMLLWGVFSAAMAFMTAPSHYYVLRFLVGAAEAGFFPGVLFYLTTWIPVSRRARFTAIFMSAIAVSGIIGGPLSGAIMHGLDGVAGLRGWQWMFLTEGLPAAVMGVLAYRLLSNTPAEAHWLDARQRALIIAELEAEAQAKKEAAHHSFGAALADPRFYALVGMSIGLIAGGAGIFLWLPTILKQSGVQNVWEIGLVSSLPFLVAIVAQQLWARHSDRTAERRWHAAIPALVMAAGWFLVPQIGTNTALATLMLTLMASGYLCATGPFWTMPAMYLTGAAAAGGIALITTIGGLGAFFAPTVAGYLTTQTGSPAAGQYLYAGIVAAGALLMLVGTRGLPAQARSGAPVAT